MSFANPIPGDAFIFDDGHGAEALWGSGDKILWSAGEPLIVCGPEGVGKSSVVEQLVLACMGIRGATFLGLPVAVTDERVLYIAADRPRQIQRSFKRMVSRANAERLNQRLVVWRGPLDFDLVTTPGMLLELALSTGATTVVIDSLKDVAGDLSKEDAASAISSALSLLVAHDIQVIVIHHNRKDGTGSSLSDVYGSRLLTAGAGSVIFIHGKPGSSTVTLRHLKQPQAEVGPLRLAHDHERGVTTAHGAGPGLADILQAAGRLTVREAAAEWRGAVARKDIAAAERALQKLVDEGSAAIEPPADGGARVYVWTETL